MRVIPRSHRSSCCLIVSKATSHIEDKLPPSPINKRLLNTYAKLRRILPVQTIVVIKPGGEDSLILWSGREEKRLERP